MRIDRDLTATDVKQKPPEGLSPAELKRWNYQRYMRDYLVMVRREARARFDAGMSAEDAARDIELGVYAAWSDAERILPNVMRCYQEFRNELDQPIDLPRMLSGMERLRGARADHTCL